MGTLEGRVAIITGSATGIGAASARLFASEGASVVLADINIEGATAVAQEIVAAGGVASATEVDVTVVDDVRRVVEETVASHGGLHILFANAGVLVPGTVEEMPVEVWQRHLAVNLTGGFLAAKFAIPAIRASGGGSMLLTGSSASMVAEPRDVAYIASKGGVLMLAKALAVDHASEGVRVNCLCPGWIDTPFNDPLILDKQEHEALVRSAIPMQRQGRPEEVAAAALFLVSDDASYINGHALVVDAGFTAQ
ncbi:SDR family NAD(P)-dependent oxidoreductase [Candidatus Poriferisocius sp.]|uniref:SDR family NAD(P)-dependent oxidoreductase n=1 Tax=Candidatus Poriferisocius sp. TaxID=3101276 RepID=UPI003B5A95C3